LHQKILFHLHFLEEDLLEEYFLFHQVFQLEERLDYLLHRHHQIHRVFQ
jgi:hypothetical protein